MRIENRMQLQLWREECKEKRQKENCCILVCGGTGCLAGGSDKIYARLKELTSNMDHVTVKIGEEIAHVGLKMSGCHGFCEMGPLVRIEPYNYLYLKVKLEDCEEIFEKSVLHGEPVTRLMYKQDNEVYQTQEEIPFYAKQTRLVLRNCGHIDAEHIEDAMAVGAYESFEKAVFEMTPEAVIKTVTDAGLRGRGGAGFPAGRKWSQVASQPEKIRYVVFPKDYIRYKMCGEIGTDMSDASSGAIFDTKKRDWAWGLIEKLQMPKEIFPECHEAYEAAGTVNKECAEQTGLKEGIKIAYGGGDTLMQGVGNGIIRPGILAANIGTSCQISGGFNEPLYDEKFRTNTFCHVKEDLWMLMGAHLSGGVALKWLMNNILEMGSYDEMTSLAATVPAGSEGLVFLPYLSGERTPYNDPNAKGIYFGMTLKHERAHMIRSTMEGIVFGLRTSIEIFKDLGIEYHKIIASGGGARGKLFLEMQADIFDCEIYTNQGNEQACIGAAITAAIAAGEFGNSS